MQLATQSIHELDSRDIMIQNSFIHSFNKHIMSPCYMQHFRAAALGRKSPATQGCTQKTAGLGCQWWSLNSIWEAAGSLCCFSRSSQAVAEPQLGRWWHCWYEATAQASKRVSALGP